MANGMIFLFVCVCFVTVNAQPAEQASSLSVWNKSNDSRQSLERLSSQLMQVAGHYVCSLFYAAGYCVAGLSNRQGRHVPALQGQRNPRIEPKGSLGCMVAK